MGLVFEVEESDFKGYIDDGTEYIAQLVAITQAERQFREGPQQRLRWKFRLISDDEFNGEEYYGETSTKLSNHPNSRFRAWAEALSGQPLLPHYRLDTDTLLDRRAKVVISKEEWNDRKTGQPQTANRIKDVRPTKATQEALAAAGRTDDYEEF